jgi:hypothetical protein
VVITLLRAMQSGVLTLDSSLAFEELIADPPPDKSAPEHLGRLEMYAERLDRLPTNVPWEAEFLELVKRYLQVRRPEVQLHELAALLEQLREAILTNFELNDVLLAVDRGHRRPFRMS